MIPAQRPRALRALLRRLAANLDRSLFPEAAAASDHWQRKVMNSAIDAYIADLRPETLSAAEISGSNHASKPWGDYRSLDFPTFDLCAPIRDDTTYDVVICEQVLEHVVDPVAAARNLQALCAPGGQAIVSTPFMIRVHELPEYGLRDYWRFTPRGLEVLLDHAGFREVHVHAWGNRECIVGNMSRWAEWRRWMPLRNDRDLPVQVWAYAVAV